MILYRAGRQGCRACAEAALRCALAAPVVRMVQTSPVQKLETAG